MSETEIPETEVDYLEGHDDGEFESVVDDMELRPGMVTRGSRVGQLAVHTLAEANTAVFTNTIETELAYELSGRGDAGGPIFMPPDHAASLTRLREMLVRMVAAIDATLARPREG